MGKDGFKIEAENVAKATVEILVRMIESREVFTFSDFKEDVIFEERFIIAFALQLGLKQIISDLKIRKRAIKSYQKYMEKHLCEISGGSIFYNVLKNQRLLDYECLEIYDTKDELSLKVGETFARFCGKPLDNKYILIGANFFEYCFSNFVKDTDKFKIV